MFKVVDEKTGKEVRIGDKVTSFRGETATLTGVNRAQVEVTWTEGWKRNYYDNVFGLKVIEVAGTTISKAEGANLLALAIAAMTTAHQAGVALAEQQTYPGPITMRRLNEAQDRRDDACGRLAETIGAMTK